MIYGEDSPSPLRSRELRFGPDQGGDTQLEGDHESDVAERRDLAPQLGRIAIRI